jgi:hypothetical protein
MDPIKLYLTGTSLEQLRARVAAEYASEARILSAELVTVGGIRGFLARRHYEVTVEIPGQPDDPQRFPAQLSAGAGIVALLADAEAAEAKFQTEARQPSVSTDSDLFTALVEDLKVATGVASLGGRHALAWVPAPASNPGDLTVVLGLGDDALRVARSMAKHLEGADFGDLRVRTAGPLHEAGLAPVTSRTDAVALRAAGVEGNHSVFVAYGLGSGALPRPWIPSLRDLGADQVWVAVDARHKHQDTARWVAHVQSEAAVYGLAVEGAAGTASPESVNELGLPIGWVDGQPTASSLL